MTLAWLVTTIVIIMIPIIVFIRIPPGAGSFLFQAAACSRVRRIPGHGDLYLVYNQSESGEGDDDGGESHLDTIPAKSRPHSGWLGLL